MVRLYVRRTFEINCHMNGGFPRGFFQFYHRSEYRSRWFKRKEKAGTLRHVPRLIGALALDLYLPPHQ